ncbi:unnamed protein product, partial [Staurois parvus]
GSLSGAQCIQAWYRVIGCHLCNKSIREISLLLNIPRSTVRGIITKWKQLGTAATQPQSGRPRKMTERSQHMLKHTVRRSHQLSVESRRFGRFHAPNFVGTVWGWPL